MASSGKDELLSAVRTLLITDTGISSAGCFQLKAPRQDALPYVLLSATFVNQARVLSGKDAFRLYRLQVKVCAKDSGGQSAAKIAKPLKDAAYSLLTREDEDGKPQDKLNAILDDKGFRALFPLEGGEIDEYVDTVAASEELERWNSGNWYHLRIEEL